MRTPKRYVALLGCAGITALFVVGMMRALRPPPSPLDNAQKVAETTHWANPNNPYAFPAYRWSGSNDLTYAQTGVDGVTHLFRHPGTGHDQTVDSEGPVAHLPAGYLETLSPDGRWFVEWHQNRLRQHVPTFVAMDGTQRREGEATWSNEEGLWTPTSDAMLMGVWRTTAAIDLYRPASGAREKIALTGLSAYCDIQQIDASGHVMVVEDGRSILHFEKSTGLKSRNYPNIKVARVDLNHPNTKPEQWTAAVPREMSRGFCFFSPTGDRILWVVYGDTTPSLARRLRRFIPGMSASPKTGYRWLVSGIHGENMREIASYPYDPAKATGKLPYSEPLWLPDGRHISFIHDDTLYTRPID